MTPSRFIDIHSHCLYGVDDGARSIEDSLAMLEMAAEAGTSDIVATPHANPEYPFDSALVGKRVYEVQRRVEGRIRLHSGCDFHLTHANVEDALKNRTKYTINGKGYLLVELSDMAIFRTTEADFDRLQKAGMTVIVTHPERNPLLRQRLTRLTDWVRSGCLLQVTAQSLFGRFGKRAEQFAKLLLDLGLVHFIASDAHGTGDRDPRLDRAFEFIAKKHGSPSAEKLFVENPRAVIEGEPIAIGPVADARGQKPNWFRRLWPRE